MSSIVPRSFPKHDTSKTNTAVEAVVADLVPYTIELHLNTDVTLVKKYGKKILATDRGAYTDVRGHHNHRFVTLLSTQRGLIEKLMREFGFGAGARASDKLTMCVRFDHYMPDQPIVYIEKSEIQNPNLMNLFERRWVTKMLEGGRSMPPTHTSRAAAAKAEVERRVREEIKTRIGEALNRGRPAALDEFEAVRAALQTQIAGLELFPNILDEQKAQLVASKRVLDRIRHIDTDKLREEWTAAGGTIS